MPRDSQPCPSQRVPRGSPEQTQPRPRDAPQKSPVSFSSGRAALRKWGQRRTARGPGGLLDPQPPGHGAQCSPSRSLVPPLPSFLRALWVAWKPLLVGSASTQLSGRLRPPPDCTRGAHGGAGQKARPPAALKIPTEGCGTGAPGRLPGGGGGRESPLLRARRWHPEPATAAGVLGACRQRQFDGGKPGAAPLWCEGSGTPPGPSGRLAGGQPGHGWHVPGGLSVHVKSSREADSSLQNNPGRGFSVGPRCHQLVSEAPQGLPHGAGQGGG